LRPDVRAQAREELELVELALDEWDPEKFRSGAVSPVTFGSAKQNFAIDAFLDFFVDLAPPPAARRAKRPGGAEEISPLDSTFTGFVFKIQANMDKRHRDRMAFIRICSGQFERGMKVKHMRLGREVRLSFSNQFVAQDRETVDAAFAGDIVGVGDTGNFQIGDSISSGKDATFDAIPKFPPEMFAKLAVPDAMKRKKLQQGIQQLAQEGTIQLFIDPHVGRQDPVIGVVGELQFEVLLFRLEDEYGLQARLQRLPYGVARWPRDREGRAVEGLNGNFQIFRDAGDQPVVLLEKEWDLNWAKKENPDVEFATSIVVERA
jgi:peptide chain release factor 3